MDAIIGLSIVSKALDNLGADRRGFGAQTTTRLATPIFGVCRGLGLSSKILDDDIAADGLLPALAAIRIAKGFWRRSPSFPRHAGHRQCRDEVRRLRADRLSAHRLVRRVRNF